MHEVHIYLTQVVSEMTTPTQETCATTKHLPSKLLINSFTVVKTSVWEISWQIDTGGGAQWRMSRTRKVCKFWRPGTTLMCIYPCLLDMTKPLFHSCILELKQWSSGSYHYPAHIVCAPDITIDCVQCMVVHVLINLYTLHLPPLPDQNGWRCTLLRCGTKS